MRKRANFLRLLSFSLLLFLFFFSATVEIMANIGEENPLSSNEVIGYITRTGSKYHRAGCHHLRRSSIPITLKDAKAYGYTACKVCRPPLSVSLTQSIALNQWTMKRESVFFNDNICQKLLF